MVPVEKAGHEKEEELTAGHMESCRQRDQKCAGKRDNFSVKLLIFSYPSILTYALGAQKNRLNETVLLSTHNICFG